jgi:hypothetical protein
VGHGIMSGTVIERFANLDVAPRLAKIMASNALKRDFCALERFNKNSSRMRQTSPGRLGQ